jgi:catechol 2,3-dioxygenase-like lactoylglutathione lyase family enzyme
MRLAGPVDHVAFLTWDVQATHEFYVDVLGWPLATAWGREEGTPPFFQIGFDAGGWTIEFEIQDGTAPRTPPPVPGFPHFGFAVATAADVDTWKAHLDSHGVDALLLGPSLYFTDPNGVTFQVFVKESHGTPEEILERSRANLASWLAR